MPFSILAYFGAISVQNKNLIQRMNFVSNLFTFRIISLGFLGWFDIIFKNKDFPILPLDPLDLSQII
jgi:hypothetical protein